MALPNIYVLEGFTWCGPGTLGTFPLPASEFLTRYNSPQASGGSGIVAGAGRFSPSSALQLAGGQFVQQLAVPNGPVVTPAVIRMGCAIKSTNWVIPGPLMAVADVGAGPQGGNNNIYGVMGLDGSGHLAILKYNVVNYTQLAVGTTVLQSGAYYYVELEVNIGHSATINVYLNGVLEVTIAGVDTLGALSGSVTWFDLCCPNAGNSMLFCDAYLSDTLLGPLRCVDVTPNANGVTDQWSPVGEASNFQCVNSIPPAGDTAYVTSATPNQIDLYAFAPLALSPAAILGVQVAFFARKDDVSAHTIAPEVRSAGTNYTGTTLPALATEYLDSYLEVYNADPATSGAWTPAGLNAAQFGVKLIS